MIDTLTNRREEIEADKNRITLANDHLSAKDLGKLIKRHVLELILLDKAIQKCKDAKDL